MRIQGGDYPRRPRGHWWQCECGTTLPEAPEGAGTIVHCTVCGQRYEYNHWALRRWAGDTAATELQPRRA